MKLSIWIASFCFSFFVCAGLAINSCSADKQGASLSIASETGARFLVGTSNELKTPRNFRLMSDNFKMTLGGLFGRNPSRAGLNKLRASGSGQYSELGLQKLFLKIPAKKDELILVDLRQESHGFLDGAAVTWYGKHNWEHRGKSNIEVALIEAERIQEIAKDGFARIYLSKSAFEQIPLHVTVTESEEMLAKRFGINYQRFYVSDHERPSDEEVDSFIAFVKQLPRNSWLHFHCAAGKGRTTTFLVMYDMMQNGDLASMDDIIRRQGLLGGVDLAAKGEDDFKKESTKKRYAFIKRFYMYCKANPSFERSWSEWIKI